MRLTLRQLQIFCAIAHHGSTTSAGLAVALSQSATSAALNELEQALATQLFDRVGKRLVLNDVGMALLPQARKLLDGAQEIEAGFQPGAIASMARLKIGCSTTIGNHVLPLVLRALRKQAPALRVDMESANSSAIARKVANFELDMGLIEGPCHLPELHAEPWLVDELLVVVGRRHPLAKQAKVTLADLRDADWLLREPGSGTREEVEQLLLRHLHVLSDTRQIGSSEAIKNMVVQGLGVSCLSRWVVEGLIATKKLTPLTGGLPRLTRRFFVITHREKFFSPTLKRFHAACQQFKQDQSESPSR
ncbi:LysR family transcriptional regulator [Xanthomonas vesicatoria]|uniref:Transcriptional regulator n=2 Tax=Xanthomonas vesicatoria TaxID=56460 RepID=A0AAJ0IW16_9XANT|nr:LysR family transcriptional regulator [Xanthomonas vesicatoria]APO95124.1 LysR family transcriptional regulator [Xanthomonas vesicatoria]APP75296.1 LysR family transcriptional regulator [Xanthomonas vesicatoria ATCC 35937]EGD09134.1 transcriptional regulator [Xanthomonas vesicatoria ATCC 35937]KHM91733.1 transcriptional regulator [Xanthomonas vesicatoria]KHM98485.1 transcriptional regulator [Xanthomonas vesicatoria]